MVLMGFRGALVWVDGELMREEEYSISPFAPGLAVGLGCFETFLVCAGEPVLWERHLERLWLGCERLSLAGINGSDGDWLRSGLMSLLNSSGLIDEPRVRGRLTVLATDFEGGVSVLMTVVAAPPPMDSMEAMVSDYRRNAVSSMVGHKVTSYAENTLALREARAAGFDEAILLANDGNVSEGTTSNVFVVRGGLLLTPELGSGCLPGVMRGVVLDLAVADGIEVAEVKLADHALFTADELFLTNSLIEICPLVKVDSRIFSVGPLTRRLQKLWRARLSLPRGQESG